MKRREVLRLGGTLATGAMMGTALWRALIGGALRADAADCPPAVGGPGPYGPPLAPDANGIMLPAGFTSRVVARSLQPVAGTAYSWHRFPDGGATFTAAGGWIYVSNSEFVGPTGASAIRFDHTGTIVDAYAILSGTIFNCAGGTTPWGTWLSCEEHDGGHVWECDPSGATPGIMRAGLGTFRHEAVAVDRRRRTLYLTEDVSDGRFYRFRPTVWRDLSAGVLEVAVVAPDNTVTWLPVPAPNDTSTPVRHQVPTSTPFDGGEGITQRNGHVYFTTKGDDRVWDYDVHHETIRILYEAGLDPLQQLTGVDNICVSRSGDLFVAEDGGNMELILISPDGIASPLLRVIGQDDSEIAGPAFDPRRGKRLYFSSQRGDSNGITYEITGPFRRVRARPTC